MIAAGWYFVVFVAAWQSGGGVAQVGPFPTHLACTEARDHAKDYAKIIVECWEVKP